jgi:chaperonin GroEL
MSNITYYDEDARRRVLAGAKLLYDAVKTTMGPKGRNVIIGRYPLPATVTHDGVTVAKAIDIVDELGETHGYKLGAELIKQAASKMNDVAGDGTTTVTVLTYHILHEANKLIAAGHNPMELRKELEEAGKQVIAGLEGMAISIDGKMDRVTEIASISAGDVAIGKIISSVIKKIGKDGVISVEEGPGLTVESEVVEGFSFDKGFVSSYMVTNTERMEAIYVSPSVVITDRQIGSFQELVPFLDKMLAAGKKDIVLIADELLGDSLPNLILNRLKGVFNVVAVKAPSYGDNRKEMLQDLAILTGATLISDSNGTSFETSGAEVAGHARRVVVTRDKTTVIEGNSSPSALKERIDALNAQVEQSTSEYEREQLDKRRASLDGKVAVIRVGGQTETEIEEKKYRVDDAVAAVKAALSEGIVPGGGVALVNLSSNITSGTPGAGLLKNALVQPFRILMENSGISPDEWLPKVRKSKPGYGVDVNFPSPEGILDNMFEIGVIDPAKVAKEAVKNAVSIAGTVMTMGALTVDLPSKEPEMPNLMRPPGM